MSESPQPSCPNCKSCNIIPLMGTLPGFAPYDTADATRLPMAECVPEEVETQWECADCGHKWSTAGKQPAEEQPSHHA